jgi:hypothetical protein
VYAKVFDQIFDSSISEDYVTRHVFMDLLVLADKDGVVDMTIPGIVRRTCVPVEIVTSAIEKLMQPDPHSRSTDHNGRRLLPLDERGWGWQIVNYSTYRNLRTETDRRDYFREYRRGKRKKEKESRLESDNGSHVHSEQSELFNSSPMRIASVSASSLSSEDHKTKWTRAASVEYFRTTFWPRVWAKIAVGKALEVWVRKVTSLEMAERVTKAAIRQGPSILDHAAKNGHSILHPATWLNQERYDDEGEFSSSVGQPIRKLM